MVSAVSRLLHRDGCLRQCCFSKHKFPGLSIRKCWNAAGDETRVDPTLHSPSSFYKRSLIILQLVLLQTFRNTRFRFSTTTFFYVIGPFTSSSMLLPVGVLCFFLTFSSFPQHINGLVPRAAQDGGPKASAIALPEQFEQAPTQLPQSSSSEQKALASATSHAYTGLKTVTTTIRTTKITGLLTTVTPVNKPTMVLVIPEVSAP